jgi:hypothetical protein
MPPKQGCGGLFDIAMVEIFIRINTASDISAHHRRVDKIAPDLNLRAILATILAAIMPASRYGVPPS